MPPVLSVALGLAFFVFSLLALWMYIDRDRRPLESWQVERLRADPAGWNPELRFKTASSRGQLLASLFFFAFAVWQFVDPVLPYPATGYRRYLVRFLEDHFGRAAWSVLLFAAGACFLYSGWRARPSAAGN